MLRNESIILVILLQLLLIFTQGKGNDGPHSHAGVLKPYDGKPIHIELNLVELATLENGDSV